MSKFNLKKHEAWRIALVTESVDNDVREIISRIIIYTIYKTGDPMTIPQIIDSIDKEVAEFDYKEIEDAIKYNESCFIKMNIENEIYYDITGEARVKFENKSKNIFDESILKFKKENNISIEPEQIKDVILNYLFMCISEDFTLFAKNIDNNDFYEKFKTNHTSENDLINHYICWLRDNNNDILVKIVLTLIDFCYLSANANDETVKKLIGNNNFYLDANVIFRLMGLNNQERKKSIEIFVEKCKVYGITLYVTNHTDKEMRETLRYYSGVISEDYLNYKGNGEINNFFGIEDNSLHSLYINNKNVNGLYDKNKFYKDLINLYEITIKQFENITLPTGTLKIDNDLKDSYRNIHKNVWDVSIETDIYNVLSIKKLRDNNKSKDVDFFITEDKKLVNWTKENISNFSPLTTFPNQWYTLFLKLGRRNLSIEEKVSFYNFLVINSSFKMTNVEKDGIKKHIANKINNTVDDGNIQDRIYRKLQYEDAKKLNDTKFIDKVIKETTEQYISEQKMEEYNNGKTDILNEMINTKYREYDKAKSNLSNMELEVPTRTHKRRITNIAILTVLAIIFIILFIYCYLSKKLEEYHIVSIFIAVIVGFGLLKVFPIDIKQCENIVVNDLKNSESYKSLEKVIIELEKEIQYLKTKRDLIIN